MCHVQDHPRPFVNLCNLLNESVNRFSAPVGRLLFSSTASVVKKRTSMNLELGIWKTAESRPLLRLPPVRISVAGELIVGNSCVFDEPLLEATCGLPCALTV